MAYTLIHRTGVSTGRVYNSIGDNLTELVEGAGNDMVGPFFLDYASLRNADAPWQYDCEFSGILMDGRQLAGSGYVDNDLLSDDLDDDEDGSDRASIVQRDTKWARMNQHQVKLYHTAPTWEDAFVWEVNQADGVATEVAPLDEWLDDERGISGDALWHPMRHALRVPVFWACYRVPLGPDYESLAEMIAANSANQVTQGGLLSMGPRGLLTALHGDLYALQHAVRLYEPNRGMRPIYRGMFLMPYDGAHEDDEVDPDRKAQTVTGNLNTRHSAYHRQDTYVVGSIAGGDTAFTQEVDTTLAADGTVSGSWDEDQPSGTVILETGDMEANVLNSNVTGSHTLRAGFRDAHTPAKRATGRLYTTVFGTKGSVRATDNSVVLWHFMTGPVRLSLVDDGEGNITGHLIVGNADSALYGPYLHLVYHEATARYSAR